ncbi:Uncharacterised protein [Sphingobacterium spiritivorum]|uniref:SIR2-like domain-containing protein n=1 Tax=Sphingobacterium spiritivorum TaxID=258 RepID=A0A380CTW8_SPHSI|nr:SIR2 family protein [Sphingobacterium spiritivorum]SUJ27853.1 Uncharacterised protein [Sphingobacterium spiritivorum]
MGNSKNTYALLIGNDINNISPGKSWNDLLQEIKATFHIQDIEDMDKPFPMLYEEIFLKAIKGGMKHEKELKTYIANRVAQINPNSIHEQIRQLPVSHIMTTNYEYSLEGQIPVNNDSVVRETTYSIYRRHQLHNKTYWHIHGECNSPNSINLGYEHYCGQLQGMRNYTISGTNYSNPRVNNTSFIRQLATGKKVACQSWIDLFFTTDIHIFGLALDFVETDLWWLLTYRARSKFYKRSSFIRNTIYYYIPEYYSERSKAKLDLLRTHDVKIVIINENDKQSYYQCILDRLKNSI